MVESMVSAKSAIEHYVIDRMDYGTLDVRVMRDGIQRDVDSERRYGWAHVEAHSNTGSRYVVVASPIPSAMALMEGGEFLVTLLYPHNAAYVMNPDYLTCSYVAQKFAHGLYRWNPADVVCVTRTIAIALAVEDDTDSAHEYLERLA